MESDDSPMQVERIDDFSVAQITLKLDRHSHYRFLLRGRTVAGEGEPIMREGATTLDGGTKPIRSALNLCHHRSDTDRVRLYNQIKLFESSV